MENNLLQRIYKKRTYKPLFTLEKELLFVRKLAYHLDVTDKKVLESTAKILENFKKQGYSIYVKATVAFILALRNSYCEPIPLEKIIITAKRITPERLNGKSIKNLYNKLKREIPPKTCYLRPTIYVKSACKKLGLSQETLETALLLTEQVCKAKIHLGKKPTVVAGAIVYIACKLNDEKKTQHEVGEALGVTAVAVRNCYKKILDCFPSLAVLLKDKLGGNTYPYKLYMELTKDVE